MPQEKVADIVKSHRNTPSLSQSQIDNFNRDGFLILRSAIDDSEIKRLERGLSQATPVDKSLEPTAPVYPEPGRYTYATQCPADPDLAFIIEHTAIVEPVRQLLGDQPRLSAYVLYDRSPGGQGIPAHQDYKRWRPVGSSMNWLFAIVPFTDFTETVGALEVAPGSHKLDRVRPGATPCLEVEAPSKPSDADFVNPNLKRGDLILMNMHLWHRAPTNTSSQNRVGLFNKYAAASAPPATGWYRYNSQVVNALSPSGRQLIAEHGEPTITQTRAIIVRQRHGQPELLCLPEKVNEGRPGSQQWQLPGGAAAEETALADWDHGNVIGALQNHLRSQIAGEAPWMSYVGDFDEPAGVSRVYGYEVAQGRLAGPAVGTWQPVSELRAESFPFGWEIDAVKQWLDPGVIRGKGLSQTQARMDQFVY